MPGPTRETLNEYRRRLAEIRSLPDGDPRVRDLDKQLVAFMLENGLGEEAPVEPEPAPGADPDTTQILLAAILQARADGDAATADALEALLDRPDEAAALLKQLASAP